MLCKHLCNLETPPLHFILKIYCPKLSQVEIKSCLIYHVQLSFDSDSILDHYIMQITS